MGFWSKVSLSKKMSILTLGTCVLTMTLFSLIPIIQSSKDKRVGKETFVKTASESLMDKVDRNLFERYGDVQAFALSEPARSGERQRITEMMNDMMQAYAPVYRLMLVLDLKGKIVAANTIKANGEPLDIAKLVEKDFSQEDWFKATAGGSVKAGTSFITDAYHDIELASLTGAKGRFMNFSAPIRSKTGEILGVWTNRVDFDDVVHGIIKEEVAKLQSEQIPVVNAYLISKAGVFLDHPEGEQFHFKQMLPTFSKLSKLSGLLNATYLHEVEAQTASFSGKMIEGLASSKGYSSYPGAGWLTVIQIPAFDSNAALYQLLGCAALAMLSLVLVLTYFTLRPVNLVLQKVMTSLENSSTQMTGVAHQLTSASSQLSASSTEGASSMEETVASIEELSSIVTLNASNAKQAASLTEESSKFVATSEVEVRDLIGAMQDISQSSKKIEEIINVIDDIAFQTNLLALNAAVEAARAGEQGKGFAVVAEAVRTLAQRSSSAAKDITGLIKESVIRTQKGASSADKSGVVLRKVVESIETMSDLNSQIAHASSEQATGIGQIGKAMNELDSATQQNAAISEEVAASSSELLHQAQSLQADVAALGEVIFGNSIQKLGETKSNHSAPSVVAKDNVVKFQPKKEQRPAYQESVPKVGTTDGF